MSCRGTVGVAREASSRRLPARAARLLGRGAEPGARGAAEPPEPGSSTRSSCSELGGNRKQAEGPAGTLSTLLTCQRRAGPRRPGGGAEDL